MLDIIGNCEYDERYTLNAWFILRLPYEEVAKVLPELPPKEYYEKECGPVIHFEIRLDFDDYMGAEGLYISPVCDNGYESVDVDYFEIFEGVHVPEGTIPQLINIMEEMFDRSDIG